MLLDVDAHSASGLHVRSYGVRVASELGKMQREDRQDNHHQPYGYGNRQKTQEISRADLGLDRRRHVGNVGASRKDLRRPEEYPQSAERSDEGRQLEFRDEQPVDEPARQADQETGCDPHRYAHLLVRELIAPHLLGCARERNHGLGGDDAGEDQYRTDRQVDSSSDDYKRDSYGQEQEF